MNDSVEVVDRVPTLEEYLELTGAVGWSSYVTAETADRPGMSRYIRPE